MVILDASGRVRETYALWETERGGLVRLKEAPKDYSPLKIKVWDKGGGKASFFRNGEELARGVAAAINERPTERWLVVHQKDALGGKFRDVVSGLVEGSVGNVSFLT